MSYIKYEPKYDTRTEVRYLTEQRWDDIYGHFWDRERTLCELMDLITQLDGKLEQFSVTCHGTTVKVVCKASFGEHAAIWDKEFTPNEDEILEGESYLVGHMINREIRWFMVDEYIRIEMLKKENTK